MCSCLTVCSFVSNSVKEYFKKTQKFFTPNLFYKLIAMDIMLKHQISSTNLLLLKQCTTINRTNTFCCWYKESAVFCPLVAPSWEALEVPGVSGWSIEDRWGHNPTISQCCQQEYNSGWIDMHHRNTGIVVYCINILYTHFSLQLWLDYCW